MSCKDCFIHKISRLLFLFGVKKACSHNLVILITTVNFLLVNDFCEICGS